MNSSAASNHSQYPPSPVPSQTPHPSRISFLPTLDLVGSIASGAHYSGAISPPRSPSRGDSARHRRSRSMSTDDPSVEEAYREVMEDLKELFCARPTLEIFERRWRRDAVFEDPLSKCNGFDEYAPQWFALPKIFSESRRVSSRIMLATLSPNRLVFSQTQVYTVRFLGLKKTVNSVVLVDLDEDFKVTRLADQWNGEEPPTRWGASLVRKINAKVTPWLIRVPKRRA